MSTHRNAVLVLLLPLAVVIAAGAVLQSRRGVSDAGPRRSAPLAAAPIRIEPAPRQENPLPRPPSPPTQDAPLDATSQNLLAAAQGATYRATRETALYALAPRQPGNAELTRSVCAFASPAQSADVRLAAYTALRFRRDDPIAAATLLAAFPGGSDAERFAAAQSLSFQRLPDMPQRLQILLAGEPSPRIQKELKAAIAYMLNQIKSEPCLTRP
jgi:hypothetical protein